MDVWEGVSAVLVDCTFDGNTLYEQDTGLRGEAIIGLSDAPQVYRNAGCCSSLANTLLRHERCSFEGDAMPTLVGQDYGTREAMIYADSQSASATECLIYTILNGCKGGAEPLDATGDGFLNSSSAWFTTVQQVRPVF